MKIWNIKNWLPKFLKLVIVLNVGIKNPDFLSTVGSMDEKIFLNKKLFIVKFLTKHFYNVFFSYLYHV